MKILEHIDTLPVPNFRKKQIIHAIFKKSAPDFLSILTLPTELRRELNQKIALRTLKQIKVLVSKDQSTVKWSFLTQEGKPIETVLMMHKNGRNTICLSCQSGCPVNCSFCWTGAMGFQQNLSAWEIIEQVLVVNEWLNSEKSKKQNTYSKGSGKENSVNRVVFMGMGEPMINLPQVEEAVEVLLDKELFGLGQRAITVSTSGYIPMMKKFWTKYPKIGLAVSLHSPNQDLRQELMPVAKQFSLEKLIQACDEIQKQTKRRATYEYILIDGVTNTEECALELAELLKNQLAHVNIIPYNPIAGRNFKRPSRNQVMTFTRKLRDLGLSATPRVTMGDDIKAACGQLSEHR